MGRFDLVADREEGITAPLLFSGMLRKTRRLGLSRCYGGEKGSPTLFIARLRYGHTHPEWQYGVLRITTCHVVRTT